MASTPTLPPPGYELAAGEELFRASTSSDRSLEDNPAKSVKVGLHDDSDSDNDDIVVHERTGFAVGGSSTTPYQHPLHASVSRTHLASVGEKKALFIKNVLITGCFIALWYSFATLLAMYNKWMFSKDYYGFSYPLFVSACHMVVQFIAAGFVRYFFPRFRPEERPTRREYATRILPTAWTTAGDIGLSNLSLKTITLSLYTMCKSSALIFVLFFAFLFHLEKYSLRLVLVIGMISFGVFLMVFNTTAVSLPGILMVFSASALGGLRWALTELIMHKRAMGLSNPFATIFWLSPLMAIGLFFVSSLAEDWVGMFREFFHGLEALKNIGVIALPGVIAFGMVSSEYFVLQRAGIVPLSVAGIFKEVSTISFSAWAFGDKLTPINIVGCAITVCGIALFSYHKYQKSINSTVEIDETGRAINYDELDNDERTPLSRGNFDHHEEHASTRPNSTPASRPESMRLQTMAPSTDDDEDDRVTRLRDDFEGWDHPGSEDEDEPDDDLVEAMREHKTRSRWAEWWDRSM